MYTNRNSKDVWASGDIQSVTDSGGWSTNDDNGAWGGDKQQAQSNYYDGWDDNAAANDPYVPGPSSGNWGNDDASNNDWSKAVKGKSKRNRRFQTEDSHPHRHFYNRSLPSMDDPSDFPSLDKKPSVPVNNVWVKRQEKFETLKALEPQNLTDEEEMIRQALEMSKKEAKISEQRKKELEEEYKLQMLILEMNPEQFSEFCTDDELAKKMAATEEINAAETDQPLTFNSFASALKKNDIKAKQQSLTDHIKENSSTSWPALSSDKKKSPTKSKETGNNRRPMSEYMDESKSTASFATKTANLSKSKVKSDVPVNSLTTGLAPEDVNLSKSKVKSDVPFNSSTNSLAPEAANLSKSKVKSDVPVTKNKTTDGKPKINQAKKPDNPPVSKKVGVIGDKKPTQKSGQTTNKCDDGWDSDGSFNAWEHAERLSKPKSQVGVPETTLKSQFVANRQSESRMKSQHVSKTSSNYNNLDDWISETNIAEESSNSHLTKEKRDTKPEVEFSPTREKVNKAINLFGGWGVPPTNKPAFNSSSKMESSDAKTDNSDPRISSWDNVSNASDNAANSGSWNESSNSKISEGAWSNSVSNSQEYLGGTDENVSAIVNSCRNDPQDCPVITDEYLAAVAENALKIESKCKGKSPKTLLNNQSDALDENAFSLPICDMRQTTDSNSFSNYATSDYKNLKPVTSSGASVFFDEVKDSPPITNYADNPVSAESNDLPKLQADFSHYGGFNRLETKDTAPHLTNVLRRMSSADNKEIGIEPPIPKQRGLCEQEPDEVSAPNLFNVLQRMNSNDSGEEVPIQPPEPPQQIAPESMPQPMGIPQYPMPINPMMMGMMNPIVLAQQMIMNPFLYRQLTAMSGFIAPMGMPIPMQMPFIPMNPVFNMAGVAVNPETLVPQEDQTATNPPNLFHNDCSGIPAPVANAASGIPAPIANAASGIPAPVANVASGIPAPVANAASGIPAPVANQTSAIPSSESLESTDVCSGSVYIPPPKRKDSGMRQPHCDDNRFLGNAHCESSVTGPPPVRAFNRNADCEGQEDEFSLPTSSRQPANVHEVRQPARQPAFGRYKR